MPPLRAAHRGSAPAGGALRSSGSRARARPGRRCRPAAWEALLRLPLPGQRARAGEHHQPRGDAGPGQPEIDLPRTCPRRSREPPRAEHAGPAARNSLSRAVEQFERDYIQRALAITGGEKKKAAQILGISRQCLYQKIAPGPDGGLSARCRGFGASFPAVAALKLRHRQQELLQPGRCGPGWCSSRRTSPSRRSGSASTIPQLKARRSARSRPRGGCRPWSTATWWSGTAWPSSSTWRRSSPTSGCGPQDPRARAVARSMCAEMHVGFRSSCGPPWS